MDLFRGRAADQAADLGRRLTSAEHRHRLILDSAVDYAILSADLAGRITEWNAGAERIFGWSRAEALLLTLPDIFTDEDRAAGVPDRELGQALVAGRAEDTRWHRRKDASRFWANGVMMPMLEDGKAIGVIKLLRDQTDQLERDLAAQKAETLRLEALRTNEAQFQTLAQSIPQLAWMAEPNGDISWFNQRWYDYTGATLEDMRGWGWASVHHPDHLEEVAARWREALAKGEPFDMTFPLRGRDGVYRWFLTLALPIRNDRGEVVRWFGTNTDVDARHAAGVAAREESAGLRDEVAVKAGEIRERDAALIRMAQSRDAAESQVRQLQKMEAVGRLTGGLAHDFNNMLAVVIGGLNLLARRLERGDTNVGKYVDAAMDGATRAASLTQRLLAFSRQQPLAPESLDANKFVAGMTELLDRTLGDEIRLETALGAGLWRTHVDPSQLENAILNLAVNAHDAMPDGGRLTIETSNAYIDDDYAREEEIAPGQYVLLAVTDTGSGMPQEVIDKAFEPFFTTKGVGKGTGLGLSQVFGFVRQSHGHVKIYSETGVGTSLKIYLPRHRGAAESAAPRAPSRPVRVGSPTEVVLVVEDEERVRMLSVDALRELGYTVVHASGGEDALKIIEAGQAVDVLFTDVVMPGMTGRQLADVARARLPELKVVYTTGYTQNAIVHNGVLDPGVLFLNKPFALDALAAKIGEAFDGR